MKVYELIPTNGRKSFYSKAIVIEKTGGNSLNPIAQLYAELTPKINFIDSGMDGVLQLEIT